jgi:hypothetical protein
VTYLKRVAIAITLLALLFGPCVICGVALQIPAVNQLAVSLDMIPPGSGGGGNVTQAIDSCEKAVEAHLEAPSTAQFLYAEVSTGATDRTWDVLIHVDSQRADGVQVRSSFLCQVAWDDARTLDVQPGPTGRTLGDPNVGIDNGLYQPFGTPERRSAKSLASWPGSKRLGRRPGTGPGTGWVPRTLGGRRWGSLALVDAQCSLAARESTRRER